MNKYSTYKDLIVYKKSESLTVECYKYFLAQKISSKHNSLIDQLLRSIGSIGANIAEGYGRHYKKNYRQFLSIARGSAFEAEYWFEVVLKLEIFYNKKIKQFQSELIEIIKMLTSIMKKLETN